MSKNTSNTVEIEKLLETKPVPIAVIDDHEQNLYTVSRYLRRAGFEVWEGGTGADALRLASNKPELIILDVKLPDIMGYDVCRQIKSNPATASIPILHTSATFIETRDKIEGLEGGADGYLTAPIKPEELLATVNALLRMHSAEKRRDVISVQWQTTFDAISSGVCLIDANGRVERCNAFLAELVGRPASDLAGRSFEEVARWAAIKTLPYKRMLETQHRETLETQVGDRWWRITVDPVFSEEACLAGAVCVIADVSERKRTEAQMRRSERNLADFFEHAAIGLHWAGPDGTILRVNQAELDMLGYAREEMVGRKISEFHVKEEVIKNLFDRLWRGETVQNLDAQMRCKDGSIKDVAISTNVLWEDGQFIHTRCFTRDVTERKRAERALRANEALLSRVLELLPVGVWITDADGNVLRTNRAGREIWGGERLVGPEGYDQYKGWWPHNGQPVKAHEWGAARAIAYGETALNEVVHIETFDGRRKTIFNSAIPMVDERNSTIGAIVVNEDITERRRNEQALVQAQEELRRYASELEQRVAERTAELQETNQSLENFCYSIAHDLRAPARAMQGFAAALLDDYGAKLDDLGKDYTQRIIRAAIRMDRLIHELLAYGRLSQMELPMNWIRLQPLVNGLQEELKDEIERKGARIEFTAGQVAVWANMTALQRILFNLAANALKFSRADVPPIVRIEVEKGEAASKIFVKDNGLGVPAQHQERIFRLFERLQPAPDHPGTGMGLALVKKAVERMGGSLGVESQAGEGSCFWCELPHPAPEPAPTEPRP